jgi:uncharacterized membrane protein
MAVATVGSDGAPPTKFFHRAYLYALTLLGTLYLLTTLLLPTPWVELPLGLVTLFVTPGYAIAAVMFGPRSRWPRSLLFALSVGFSVAFNVALGLGLLALGLGLPALAFAVAAFLVVGAVAAGWATRRPESAPAAGPSAVSRELGMRGYRPAQRAAAYVLLVTIALVFVGIVYLASVFPANSGPGVALSVYGSNGTPSGLPTVGSTNTTLSVLVAVQNNATAHDFALEVQSAPLGETPPTYHTSPWSTPLELGNDTEYTESVPLAGGQSTTLTVPFQYRMAGNYLVSFELESPSGSVLRTTSFAVDILGGSS